MNESRFVISKTYNIMFVSDGIHPIFPFLQYQTASKLIVPTEIYRELKRAIDMLKLNGILYRCIQFLFIVDIFEK